MLQIQSFIFNPFQENTFILYNETKDCIVVDPGCSDESENAQLAQFIEDEKLSVKMLLNTHCHIDHVLGNQFVKETFHTKLLIHPGEQAVLKAVEVYAPNYGFH